MTDELEVLRTSHWKGYYPFIQIFFYLGEGYSLGTLLLVVPLYVIRVFNLETDEAGIATAFAGIPWLIKIFYGMISDKYPIGKYGRRKPYLVLIGLVSIPLWLYFPTLKEFNAAFLGTLFLISMLAAFADTTLDGYVIDITPEAHKQLMQSGAWAGRGVGTILASLISLSLVEQGNYQLTYYIAGAVFVITTLSAVFLPVINLTMQNNVFSGLKSVLKLKTTQYILLISTFMGAGQVMYAFASVLLSEYGLVDIDIRDITTIFYIGNVLGAVLIGMISKIINMQSEKLLVLILISGFMWSPMILISEEVYFLMLYFFILGMTSTAGTAILSKIAMDHSPVEVSSSMFAIIMSVNNFGLLIVAPLFTGFLLKKYSPVIVILLALGWFVLAGYYVLKLIKYNTDNKPNNADKKSSS